MCEPNDRYATMRQIGKPIDMTSHDIGRVLRQMGWRNPDGSPSMTARDRGWAIAYVLDCGGYAWKWSERFVRVVVEQWRSGQASETKGGQGGDV